MLRNFELKILNLPKYVQGLSEVQHRGRSKEALEGNDSEIHNTLMSQLDPDELTISSMHHVH